MMRKSTDTDGALQIVCVTPGWAAPASAKTVSSSKQCHNDDRNNDR
jgi:hypothetical protein